MSVPNCPKCNSTYVYEHNQIYTCPICAFEWAMHESLEDSKVYKDAFGTILIDGDDIIVLKDLKVKGSSSVVKQGTKVKGIRLVDSDHDIDCRVDGIGKMSLKTEFVKKA